MRQTNLTREDDAPAYEVFVALLMFSPIWLLAGLGWLFLVPLLRAIGL